MSNVVCYGSDGEYLKALYQWDCNQTISISGISLSPVPTIHICNRLSDKAVVVGATVSNNMLVAKIPNAFLVQAEPITVFVYVATGSDGHRTTYAIHIPVIPRPQPEDYEYENNIEYTDWVELSEQAVALFNTLQANADAATSAANNAANSANSAAEAANSAAAVLSEIDEVDGVLFVDEDEEISFIGKFRVVDGHPALLCTQVNS